MIHLSQTAAQEIRRLQAANHQTKSHHLQVSIAPGGCQALAYVLAFVETAQVSEHLQPTDQADLQVAIAPEHLGHLANLTLDYAEDLMGGSFRFENPNVAQTCGCGHSFTLAQ
ncbi:MAG: iron-sulfur cluster assembly accessory protein [Spirulina sp. SIO3F2]|nr:iron-sulfur cluster assembly accessory protein [Spirulina sp. SIO3F2]